MSRKKILQNVDPDSKDSFQGLWKKIEEDFGPQIALSYCQMIAQDPQKYYNFLFTPYDSICDAILSMISQEKLQISGPTSQVSQKDPMPIKKVKQDLPSTINNIKNPEIIQEHKIKKQIAQKQFSHLEQIKLNLKRGRQFASNFKQKDFDEFEQFHMIYQTFPLIQRNQLTKQAKRRSKASNDLQTLLDQLILVDSALYYSSPQHRLRITQILAIYGFLLKPNLKTILFQILTGEGKSTTIACIAAILTMRGRNVDIITTNNILAKRDVQEKRDFFNLLGIKVDHNIPPSGDHGNQTALKPKPCYEKGTAVYGTPFSYQVDLLFDEYKKRFTRNGRPYDVAIIDEVDSMFIDEKANQTLLSSTFAGFSDLVLPMRILWQTIVLHNIVKEGDKLILYKQGAARGEIIKGQMNEVMRIIVQDIRQKFKNEIIPTWRQQFIDFSMKDWIWSAIQAAHVYKEDEHYVIKDDKIIPVDYRNTGCLQNNVEWEHGLHQFLQIKHDLEVSIESMTSNFMSNIGHFTRYKTIYGLTGTLGSHESKKFLQKTYSAEMLEIPPFLERRLKIQPGFFMYSDSEWIQKILQRVNETMKQNRSVLIICQTIKHVKVIQEAIKLKNIRWKSIRCHLTGQQNHSDHVDCSEIIIATNVAGRGTDLKASKKLVQNGGLHVMISFMPENLRVQMQARGRAGRNGAPGSSQLIVNHQEYFDEVMTSPIDEFKFRTGGLQNKIDFVCQLIRDKMEASSMERDLHKVEELKTKDRVFEYFCKTVGKIQDYQTNKAKRDALEEAWAMFLKKAECLNLSNEELQVEAKNLVDTFAMDSQGFYNPSHTVWRGINEINHNNLEKANHHFKALDASNTTTMNKIAGRLMQSSINIKQDDKKTKANYGNALNMMNSCIGLIEERKDIVKGINAINLTSNNRKIVGVMNQQKEKQTQKLLNSLNREKIQFNPVQNVRVPSNVQNIRNENIEPIERRNIEEMINIPEVNVLNAIGDHIKKQMNIIQNVKPNEYVDIKFEPLSKILDMTENKQKPSKEVTDKLATDIPVVPVAQIKKIKVPWWKRALVFAVGVLQICLGALIVSASCGAAASFGSYMMYSGFQSCMTAIFKPEMCDNLSQFFSKKAIEYTVAIAMMGAEGIMELAQLSKNGFQLIQNSSMSEVLKKAMTGIKEGLVKGGFDIGAIIKKTAFMGLSSQLGGQMIGQDMQETFKVLQKPQVKKMVDEGVDDQKKLEFKGKAVQQNFQAEAQKIIKQLVEAQYPKFIKEISSLKIDPRHIRIMIGNSFQEEFKKFFGQKERNEIYKEMLAFISKNLMEKELANKVIKQFKIDQLIRTTIQNMGKSQDYQIVVKNSELQLRNDICQAFNKVVEKYSQELKTMENQLKTQNQQIDPNRLSFSEHQSRVKVYNEKVQVYQKLGEKLKDFAQEFKRMDEENNVASYLMRKNVIINGKIDKSSNFFRQLHPYNQEALSKVPDFETGQNQFKQCLEAQAYNSFAGIAVKAVTQIIDNSSCSISRLKWIEQKFMESMQKP